MSLSIAHCSHCGCMLLVDENEITAVCGFCDETVVVDEVIIKFEKNTVGIPDCDKTPDDGKSCNF